MANWQPSFAGKLKLNTDGSKYGDHGLAGYGGAVRDEECTWIKGFMGQIGHSSVLEAELRGIHRGMVIVYEENKREVTVECDSLDAVTFFMSDDLPDNFQCTQIVIEIKRLLTLCNSEIKHIPRSANKMADALARMGRNQNETLVIIDNPPANIVNLLIDDIVGCCNKGV